MRRHPRQWVTLPGRLFKFWFLIYTVISCGFRFGEAVVPGPDHAETGDCPSWSLSVCNPSGLQGKTHVLATTGSDIVCISETHLTARARDMLAATFRSKKAHYSHLVAGAPVAARSDASDAGYYSGVAIAACHPCRAMQIPWPPDLYESNRVQFATTWCHSMWVSGAVVYGYPEGKYHANALERTDTILSFVSSCLFDMQGPRFAAGDWNHELNRLSTVQLFHDAGWIEAQDLFAAQTGTPPRMTCKAKTRKDFLFLSPELARMFQSVSIDDTAFADHSILTGHFRGGTVAVTRYLWPCPQQVDWSKVQDADSPCAFDSGSPTELYKQLWMQQETRAQMQLGSQWTSSMAGRGQQWTPRQVVGWSPPVRKGRSCDVQPGYLGFDRMHAKWFKQLRRLQNYVRWSSGHDDGSRDVDALQHGLALWASIRSSSGFVTTFADWWPQRSHQCVGDPPAVPEYAPSFDVASAIFVAFQYEVRLLELRLQAARAATRKQAHEDDPYLFFKELRRPPAQPVETLVQPVVGKVCEVDHDECAVVLQEPSAFDSQEPVSIKGKQVEVFHAAADKLWLGDLANVEPGDKVVQTKQLGHLDAIFEAFHEQWKQRWCAHDRLPHTHWQEIIDFARCHMPFRALPCPQLTPELFRSEVAAKKPTAATGLDGVSRADLMHVGDNVIASVLSMFARAEASGDWPKQVTAGKVCSLAKTPAAQAVNEYRPITIFGLSYRIWSSLRARFLLHDADSWVDPLLFGNRRGCQAAHLWKMVVYSIEEAYSSNTSLSGLTADVVKAFNCIPRWPVLMLALQTGCPHGILNAWAGALAAMRRHFKVRDSLSDGFVTSTGLAEGCSLSCYGMLLLDQCMHVWVAAQNPQIRLLSYVDNLEFITSDPAAAVHQLDLALKFTSMVDLTLDRSKTYAWSVQPDVRRSLRQAGLPVKHLAKDLGAHIGFSRQFTNCFSRDRMQTLEEFWPKCSFATKVRALRTMAWPRGLYAVSSAPIGAQQWLALRRQASYALGLRKPGVNPAVTLGLVESSVMLILFGLQFLPQFEMPEFSARNLLGMPMCYHMPVVFLVCLLMHRAASWLTAFICWGFGSCHMEESKMILDRLRCSQVTYSRLGFVCSGGGRDGLQCKLPIVATLMG